VPVCEALSCFGFDAGVGDGHLPERFDFDQQGSAVSEGDE
jgi:hypothetical protein